MANPPLHSKPSSSERGLLLGAGRAPYTLPMASHPSEPTLPRVLGPWAATAIVVGTVIGSGVFLTPKDVAARVECSGLAALVWILGGLLTLAGALVYAEVVTVLPRAGGNYVFLREAYGRLAGWLWGWVDFLMIRSGSIAALATAFTISLHEILTDAHFRAVLGLGPTGSVPELWQCTITIAVILALGAVNIRGVQWGAGLQLGITILKVGTIAAVAVVPLWFLGTGYPVPGDTPPSTVRLVPVWPQAIDLALLAGFGTALLAVLWPYHGWQNIAPIAGEIREPQRSLPIALIAGVGIVILLYLGCNLGYHLLLDNAGMKAVKKETTTATVAMLALLGPLGKALISGVILCSVFGSLNGNLLVGPRLLFAMAEDGLAPTWLRGVHPRWRTPAAAIAVQALWASGLILGVAVLASWGVLEAGKGPFSQLVDFAMFGAIIFETLAVLTIFSLRRKLPDVPRPYMCPLYPWLPAGYVVLPLFILGSMLASEKSRTEAFIGLGFIATGVAVYFVLGLGQPVGQPTRTDESEPDSKA